MRIRAGLAGFLASLATAATAGGVERSAQSIAVLFEEGRYLEIGGAHVSPSVSGVGGLVTPGAPSGSMTETFATFGAAYRADLDDTWSYAIVYEQPYGAAIDYPTTIGGAPSTYFAAGSTATLAAHALIGILQYNLPSNLSFYGGIRAQTLVAEADVPFLGLYSAKGERDLAFGYLVGVAYEKPEIALRVALTYHSQIDHDLTTTENSALGAGRVSPTDINTPQALNLEFQSGVAADTLVFGAIRWVDWTAFEITPDDYNVVSGGGSLVSFADDRVTYTLGLGRRLNESWSVAGSLNFEDHTGSPTGNLGPTDGRWGATLAAVHKRGNMTLTTGLSYVAVGDADTQVGAAVPGGIFRDNHAWGAGIKVGFRF